MHNHSHSHHNHPSHNENRVSDCERFVEKVDKVQDFVARRWLSTLLPFATMVYLLFELLYFSALRCLSRCLSQQLDDLQHRGYCPIPCNQNQFENEVQLANWILQFFPEMLSLIDQPCLKFSHLYVQPLLQLGLFVSCFGWLNMAVHWGMCLLWVWAVGYNTLSFFSTVYTFIRCCCCCSCKKRAHRGESNSNDGGQPNNPCPVCYPQGPHVYYPQLQVPGGSGSDNSGIMQSVAKGLVQTVDAACSALISKAKSSNQEDSPPRVNVQFMSKSVNNIKNLASVKVQNCPECGACVTGQVQPRKGKKSRDNSTPPVREEPVPKQAKVTTRQTRKNKVG